MLVMKLDRFQKMLLRQRLREMQEEQAKAEHAQHLGLLRSIVERRLAADYGDKQDDMRVLAKYGFAKPCSGANISLYNPDTCYWDEMFGVELAEPSPLLIPERASAFGAGYPTAHERYSIGKDDPDYALIWPVVEWRRSFKRRQTEERDAFEAAMRATSSLRVLAKTYPWVLKE